MKIKKVDYTELIAGLIVVAISIIGYISTIGAQSFATTVGVSSTDIPRWICVVMFLLGLGIASKWFVPAVIKKNPPMIEVEVFDKKGATAEALRKEMFHRLTAPITIALIFLYILLFEVLGFVIDTTLYLTLQITLLSTEISVKSLVKYFIISVVAAILIFVAFGIGFKMQLPVNRFGF